MTDLPNLPDMRVMILSAGLGTRLRPITDVTPKPLVKVAGQALIDYCFDLLRCAGIRSVVVNKHHLAGQISEYVGAVTDLEIAVSDETAVLLETGGGVKKALPLLGASPFFVLNSDVIVLDSGASSLLKMHDLWDSEKMDALLLLHPVETAVGYAGKGDFHLGSDGRLTRRTQGEGAPYLFTGVQILNPVLFDDTPDGAFSLNLLYDKALANGRLYGLLHEGHWLHVGTPDAVIEAGEKIEALR
ncbi:nucleotidyltransferase family protein [Sneathiella sp. HT1-7]|uniref:nucleotidyltransferase family protein n=1 Tax=Sneathiella sp. HT1-7 TaxID=2887192 RepID=UPI001D14BC16|nr:nucleotidyltransferase family protein [Sneathiella sp. HT1-7]MCC3303903.1 nucleotidyltransferase family protein [Sneathiella sp. HT1-7]